MNEVVVLIVKPCGMAIYKWHIICLSCYITLSSLDFFVFKYEQIFIKSEFRLVFIRDQ